MPKPTADTMYPDGPSNSLGNQGDAIDFDSLNTEEKQALRKNSEKVLGDGPEHRDVNSLIETIHEAGSIRISPNPDIPSVLPEFLKKLPDDIERIDINEFGKGHKNNTIYLRSKRSPALTS